jgi:hypothetical protein
VAIRPCRHLLDGPIEIQGGELTLKIPKVLVWLEAGIALAAGALGILTIFWRDWIEILTGWDPDHHNGRAEWLIVVGLLTLAAVAGSLARRHWTRLTAAAVAE